MARSLEEQVDILVHEAQSLESYSCKQVGEMAQLLISESGCDDTNEPWSARLQNFLGLLQLAAIEKTQNKSAFVNTEFWLRLHSPLAPNLWISDYQQMVGFTTELDSSSDQLPQLLASLFSVRLAQNLFQSLDALKGSKTVICANKEEWTKRLRSEIEDAADRNSTLIILFRDWRQLDTFKNAEEFALDGSKAIVLCAKQSDASYSSPLSSADVMGKLVLTERHCWPKQRLEFIQPNDDEEQNVLIIQTFMDKPFDGQPEIRFPQVIKFAPTKSKLILNLEEAQEGSETANQCSEPVTEEDLNDVLLNQREATLKACSLQLSRVISDKQPKMGSHAQWLEWI